ncbi:MAG: FapA family protein [Candidatus Muiribacteriota bacterium]
MEKKDGKNLKSILNEGIDIITELEKKYNIKVENINENDEIKDIESFINSEDGAFEITVTQDKMKAFIDISPAKGKGKHVTVEEIKSVLTKREIKYGVDYEKIIDLVKKASQEEKIEKEIIASGKPVIEPIPIKYNMLYQQKDDKSYVDEKGRIDYREMNKILSVKNEEKIIELIPGKSGQKGININGTDVFPAEVSEQILTPGINVVFKEEDNSFYSESVGQVKITPSGEVSVIPELTIDRDFDLNTGNIDYEGTLIIKGNVHDGFEIKVSGDIFVEGNIYGSNINCGGSIFVEKGIVSKSKYMISAGKNIDCKFIENSTIFAEGNVNVTKAVIRSEIGALGKVIVKGERGQIVGSTVYGFEGVECEEAGSSMGTRTVLGAGVNYYLLKEMEEKQKYSEELRAFSLKIRNYMHKIIEKFPDKRDMTQEVIKMTSILNAKNKVVLKEIEDVKTKIIEMESRIYNITGFPYIWVHKEMNSGVSVLIGRAITLNEKREYNVKFVWDKALNTIIRAAV